MKRCLFLFILLSFISHSFCQSNDSLGRLRDHYLLIGRRETRTGTIMVSGGVLLIVTGAYISYRLPVNHAAASSPFDPNPGNITSLIGVISTVVSIPVFIAGETHKSKARHLSLSIQKSEALVQPDRISPVFQPALTLTINLSKRKRTD